MINAHKGDHVLIAISPATVEAFEVTASTYMYITANGQQFWRTTGNCAGGVYEHPYIVRKVAADKVEFARGLNKR